MSGRKMRDLDWNPKGESSSPLAPTGKVKVFEDKEKLIKAPTEGSTRNVEIDKIFAIKISFLSKWDRNLILTHLISLLLITM